MKLTKHSSFLLGLLLSGCLSGSYVFGAGPAKADLSRLVIVGDSLSAGVQNYALLDSQQVNGYPSLVAKQAGVPLTLPLVPFPGAPNVLQLKALKPRVIIEPAVGTLPNPPRTNPTVQATNLAIPGITIGDALLAPNQMPPSKGNVIGWAQIVLGYPGPAQSLVNQALALNPTTMFVSLGNNDALVPAISGFLPLLTPLEVFSSQFSTVMSRLATSRATLLVANIPDVTQIPYFTSPRTLAQQAGLPLSKVTTMLGIQEGDLLRRTAVSIALDILAGGAPPAPYVWPTSCPLPVPGLLPPGVPLPCILSATDASTIRSATAAYNAVIQEQTARYGATLVDLNALVTGISRNGYKAGGYCLSTGFLGGLFSLDGIHPSNSGYAVIANLFIDRLNSSLNTRINPVKVSKIAKADPLVFPGSLCGDDDDDDDDEDDDN